MKLVRPLGIEPLNDESEPYPSKGLRIPVDEMHAQCTQCVRYRGRCFPGRSNNVRRFNPGL